MNSCTTIIVIIIQIKKSDILSYDGVGKPPHCEVTFKAISGISTPPDLTATVSFPTITFFTISRTAEIPPKGHNCHCVSHHSCKYTTFCINFVSFTLLLCIKLADACAIGYSGAIAPPTDEGQLHYTC